MNWMTMLAGTTGLWGTLAAQAPQAEASNTAYIIAAFALIGCSVLFFILELFVPSGGIFALICGACTIASVVTMFMYTPALGLILLIGYVIVGPFAIYWGIRVWEQSGVGRRLILDAELDSAATNELGDPDETEEHGEEFSIRSLVGEEGVTDSSLRPVGFVKIKGRRVDAIAEGDLIEAGRTVRVVDAYDNQLKVREVPDDQP